MTDPAPPTMDPRNSFQGLILTLQHFWAEQGCVILQPYDMQMGAGTFHTATTLRALGPKPLERRLCAALAPAQGRPLRRKPQPAAALLPVPGDPEAVAATTSRSSICSRSTPSASTPSCTIIRFVEDDWESPTLGAWGLGWEVLVRRHGSQPVHLFPAGRRLRMQAGRRRDHLRARAPRHVSCRASRTSTTSTSTAATATTRSPMATCSCRTSRRVSKLQFRSRRHRHAVPPLRRRRDRVPGAARQGRRRRPPHPGRPGLRAGASRPSHNFNLLDARGVISVTERQSYILRIRELAKACGAAWLQTAGGGAG